MKFEDFIPKSNVVYWADPETVEKIKTARKAVIKKILTTNLTKEEKIKVIEKIDNITYLAFDNLDKMAAIKGKFERKKAVYKKIITGSMAISGYVDVNNVYIEDFAETSSIIHEIYHAASSALTNYIGFQPEFNAERKRNEIIHGLGLDESCVSYFTSISHPGEPEINNYMIGAAIFREIAKNIGPEKVLSLFLKGDEEGLIDATAQTYYCDRELAQKLFTQFDFLYNPSISITKKGEEKLLIEKTRCNLGVSLVALDIFAKMFTYKEMHDNKGQKEAIDIYYDLIEKSDFDSAMTVCYAAAKASTKAKKIPFFDKSNVAEAREIQWLKEEEKEKIKNNINQQVGAIKGIEM